MRGDLREGEFTYADRTDDVETKVELLRRALRERDYAVALGLADSIKATVTNERALEEDPGTPVLPASGWRPVEDLPAPWARWANGWARYQGLALSEPIGQARQAEPVDLVVGRPFTDALWMDEAGRVHEGPVPPEHAERVWGQGFYNRDGRESMFAIYLAHRVEAPAGAGAQATAGVTLHHEGSMQLDYSYTAGGLSGHNQIWNRAHLRNPRFTAGVAVVQRNAYLFAPYPAGAGAAGLEMLRQRLLHPLVPSCAADELAGGVATAGSDDGDGLARKGERSVDWGRKRAIWEALRKVPDEEFYKVDANVVDMGYVYDVRLRGEDVHVLMTMPRRGRPKHNFLANPMRARVEKLAGVRSVVVDLTWEPAWTPNRLSAAGRQAMGLDG